jgi:hypothetical protein
MRRSLFGLVLVLAVAPAGCGGRSTPSPPAAAPDSLNAHGVRYELPLTGSDTERAAEFLRAVRPNGLSWSGGGHTLEVADVKVTLDGKPRGSVKAGDVVKLTADGTLSVNGEKR